MDTKDITFFEGCVAIFILPTCTCTLIFNKSVNIQRNYLKQKGKQVLFPIKIKQVKKRSCKYMFMCSSVRPIKKG